MLQFTVLFVALTLSASCNRINCLRLTTTNHYLLGYCWRWLSCGLNC